LVASIYGQNFARMPFLHNKAGFWISMGMMFLFSGAILLYFRKKRWL